MASPGGKERVCIFGDSVASALEGNVVGGAELQAAFLAQALQRAGMAVQVVDPRVSGRSVTRDGITVCGIPQWDRGIRGLRMFTHRIPGLLRTCRAHRPTIYYARGFSFIFLPLLIQARLTGAIFVLAIASDLDIASFEERYTSFYRGNASLWDWISSIIPNHLTASVILRWAHVVLVQHSGQASVLKGEGIIPLPNIVSEDVFQVPAAAERRNVLLVGLLAAQKGLREFLPVIRELSEITFEFVGGPSGQDGQHIEDALRQCPNVILHGRLPRAETLQKTAGACLLLNVSPAEGFPNTFLEAWALGTPVVSLHVDPGGVIAREGLGLVCGGDTGKLAEALRSGSYAVDPELLRTYVREHHSMAMAARLFSGLSRRYLRGTGPTQSAAS